MTVSREQTAARVPLSRSQQNMHNGVLQNDDPDLYLIAKRYWLRPLELSAFLASLAATIEANPAQLCVLAPPRTEHSHPELELRLRVDDLVRVQSEEEGAAAPGGDELTRAWLPGLLEKPLVRYTVRTDGRGLATGFDLHAHHILLDGGAIAVIEADLARRLTGAQQAKSLGEGMAKLAQAHRRETAHADEAARRHVESVRRELARPSGSGHGPDGVPAAAAKGVLRETVRICGEAYDQLLSLAEREQAPLNVLVAAAAAAVSASLRQNTEGVLVHAVDNRFGDPELDVATCLVNSVAHPFRFAPFASTCDVVRALDRDYVTAMRRRWFREEQYRRMSLTLNQSTSFDAVTLNFLPEPCAPELRPHLSRPPVVTDVGPVEGVTVACVQDHAGRALELAIWARADMPEETAPPQAGQRIADALGSFDAMWRRPIAATVGEWSVLGEDGAARSDGPAAHAAQPSAPAWFLDPCGGVRRYLERRRHVDQWVAWLAQNGVEPGDIVVLVDDTTDKTLDLLVACHLAGCGYSACDSADEAPRRAASIAEYIQAATHTADVGSIRLPEDAAVTRRIAQQRREQVARDERLAEKTAYIMPTSGSTGTPKLVRVSHGSLALFCASVRRAYGWGAHDVLLQCATLTSDISVEEVFGAAFCGAALVRTSAVQAGDLQLLARELAAKSPTILDVPTAVWHLLCDDGEALDAISCSGVRQIVIGGEAIRSGAVDKWVDSGAWKQTSLVSTYGPTETTVVVTELPIVCDGSGEEIGAVQRRLGRPIVANTVFVAFGEVVVVGGLVSSGYLGTDDPSFGFVTEADGSRQRAFATADRVVFDDGGHPVFCGRKDAVVKIAGKRVDTAEVLRRVAEDPAVTDVGVEVQGGRLGVWFQTRLTSAGSDDPAVATRVRRVLADIGISSFFVIGAARIPRKPNGKIDSASLPAPRADRAAALREAQTAGLAAGLAQIWSRHLGRTISPQDSLLAEGVGSLDLIRILPDTRAYLARPLSLLDLISADSAAQLADAEPALGRLGDEAEAEVAHELDALRSRRLVRLSATPLSASGEGTVVVLGASGVFGTGFAQAVLERAQAGLPCPEVVLVVRSELPARDPWLALERCAGVRIRRDSFGLRPHELEALIRETGARTVVNSIGSTNMLARYREIRQANVRVVASLVEACAAQGARLVHLSTFGVNASAAAPRVIDPRAAMYPYAAAKSLAELAVCGPGAPAELDFTLVRLPRVLGTEEQIRGSTDILVSMVDACSALRAYPAVTLREEVTTGRDAARRVLGVVPEIDGSPGLGRSVTVLRGQEVAYAELLGEYAPEAMALDDWKHRLDRSDWAKRNPGRWSIIDVWVALLMKFGARSYTDYFGDFPTIGLEAETVVELATTAQPIRPLLESGRHGPKGEQGNG
jgi:non-ribosomal peptide synthetase component F/nucleoside-diphosphate-sugar epimerase